MQFEGVEVLPVRELVEAMFEPGIDLETSRTLEELSEKLKNGRGGGSNLFIDFLVQSGLIFESVVTLHSNLTPPRSRVLGLGWELFLNWDDFTVAVYNKQKPVSSMYESSRGHLYQAGSYFFEEESFFYAHNLRGDDRRPPQINEWVEVEDPDACCSVARDWLQGTGIFKGG